MGFCEIAPIQVFLREKSAFVQARLASQSSGCSSPDLPINPGRDSMRTIRKSSGLAFGAILLTLSAQAAEAQGSAVEAEILAAGEAWLAALDRADADAMDRMETNDFVFVQDGFLVNKPEQIGSIRNLRNRPALPVTPTRSVKVNSLSVEGDVAVMTGTRTIEMGGSSFETAFTEVWVRTSEGWLVKAAHYSTGSSLPGTPPE
jgi:ketosteroid isomerase-like protein